jgi:hypothetical protein
MRVTLFGVRPANHELQGLRIRCPLHDFVKQNCAGLQLQGKLCTVALLAGHRTFCLGKKSDQLGTYAFGLPWLLNLLDLT